MNSTNSMVIGLLLGVLLGAGGMAVAAMQDEDCTLLIDGEAQSSSMSAVLSSDAMQAASSVDQEDLEQDERAVQAYLDAAAELFTEAEDMQADGELDAEAQARIEARFNTIVANLQNALRNLQAESADAASAFTAEINGMLAEAEAYISNTSELRADFNALFEVK